MTTTPKRPLLSTFVIAAISLASPLLSSSAHANLVVNGGFEAGATVVAATGIGGTAVGGGDASLTNGDLSGWTVGPTSNGLVNAIATNNSAYFGTISATGQGNGADAVPGSGVFGAGGGGPRSGALAAVFPNGLPYDGYISQAIAGLTQGEIYRVSFWLSNQLGDVANNSLGVTFGASTVLAPTALTVPMGWTLYTQDVVADATTMNLIFTAGNTPAGNLLDDVSVIAVPEVSSFGMLTGLGLLAFGTAARFRRRSVATA
jgi:hypothetical protein